MVSKLHECIAWLCRLAQEVHPYFQCIFFLCGPPLSKYHARNYSHCTHPSSRIPKGPRPPDHRVLKVDPDKRTKAMEVGIKSQELATEAGRLLLSTRAKTQQLDMDRLCDLKGNLETSDEAVVMDKVDLLLYPVRHSVLPNGL